MLVIVTTSILVLSCEKKDSDIHKDNESKALRGDNLFFADRADTDSDDGLATVNLCAYKYSDNQQICRSDLSLGETCDRVDVLNTTEWYYDITIEGIS